MTDFKNSVYKAIIVLLLSLGLPTIGFYLIQLNANLNPSIYLSSGFSSIIAVAMTIILLVHSQGKGIWNFLKYYLTLSLFLIGIGLVLVFIVNISVDDAIGILFGAFFGFCIGLAFKIIMPKETK